MKRIEYVVSYAEGQKTIVAVYARNLASGIRKVAKNCDKNIPESWGNIHSIEFWAVTS
jgi:hypothetical protein